MNRCQMVNIALCLCVNCQECAIVRCRCRPVYVIAAGRSVDTQVMQFTHRVSASPLGCPKRSRDCSADVWQPATQAVSQHSWACRSAAFCHYSSQLLLLLVGGRAPCGLRGIMRPWFKFWFRRCIYCLLVYIICCPTYPLFFTFP